MKYLVILLISVALVVCTATFLLLAYASGNIGLSLCIGAILVFVVGQFLDLLQDEIQPIEDQEETFLCPSCLAVDEMKRGEEHCPSANPFHYHHDGCPSCHMYC